MNYTTRADNTQKVYLCETPLDVVNILRTDYDYLYDAISDEGIILKGLECNLFKEIVFDSKVVGFCSYDFSSEFITAALNNIYVLPEFRGNGLFLAELQKTMVEYNKPSIIEPTRLVVELLVKYGFASKISDTLVASSLEFIVPGNHVQSNSDYQKEELSTHFYDLNICSSIHFLDIEKGIIAYSSPLNYDIIHYDCLNKRKSMDDDYFTKIRDFLLENDVDIVDEISRLEDILPVKSYDLEEVVGDDEGFSSYIQSLIDDGHVTYARAYEIKQQMSEEYEAGMILNESLLIRMAYLFDDSKKPTIKSHTDTCPYCSMPIDSHDRFCHFCGINLNYNPEEMFESLVNTFNESDNELSEDIRYVAYKFLKMILEGIELEYAIMTCENAYNLSGNLLMKYLDENNYLKGNEITDEGHDFLRKHPLHLFEKYELDAFDYSDFERYFYENENLDDKKIVLSYLEQFSDDDAGDLKKEIKNGN
ncbi:GNAT family N-acetyltransferase [Methanobrevibacter sp.]|uniref:GNAT family N-acetyltransferase n=1 Tax=Methanobrevibacter sp. TaxID=66852 RepID=UPI003863CA66